MAAHASGPGLSGGGKPIDYTADLPGRPELQAIPVGGWIKGAVVTVRCEELGLAVAALAGKGIPRLSGGVGGTSAVDVPGEEAAVDWQTHPPFALTIPLMLDGYSVGRSIVPDLNRLYRMARAKRGARRPPTVTVTGPVPEPRNGTPWLIEDIDEGDEAIRPDHGGPRLRQDLILSLVHDRAPNLVVEEEPPSARHARTSFRNYRVKHSDLKDGLRGIAKRLKVKGGWKALAKLNHIRDPKRIHAGQVLKVPT